MPKFPNPADVFSAIDKAGSVIDKGLGLIDKVSDRLDRIGLTEEPLEHTPEHIPDTTSTIQDAEKTPEIEPQRRTASTTPRVSDKDTLLYQLDHLFSVLKQAETHLSEGCRIMGTPCDCCAKHALEARTYARETISIAARMDRETSIYQDISDWASRIEEIETPEKVESGEYDETYRKESGTASKFRKKVQSMIAELKKEEDCPGCEEMRETISSFIEKKRERGGASKEGN